MNETNLDSDLEGELRRLRPAAASSRLDHGLSAALGGPAIDPAPASRRASRTLWVSLCASWTLTAAAAAAAAVAWWPVRVAPESRDGTQAESAVESSATEESRIIPVATRNVLTAARDEGLVQLDDGSTARQVRLHYVDTVQLRDGDAQAAIAISRPREEVRFVPVSFY